jgi:hypothetical protein
MLDDGDTSQVLRPLRRFFAVLDVSRLKLIA